MILQIPPTADLGKFEPKNPGGYVFTDTATSLSQIISNLIGFLTALAGVSFLLYFMFGAINWITAGGDQQKTQAAKTTLTNAIIGLMLSVIAYPVALLIGKLVGVPLADPGELIKTFFK